MATSLPHVPLLGAHKRRAEKLDAEKYGSSHVSTMNSNSIPTTMHLMQASVQLARSEIEKWLGEPPVGKTFPIASIVAEDRPLRAGLGAEKVVQKETNEKTELMQKIIGKRKLELEEKRKVASTSSSEDERDMMKATPKKIANPVSVLDSFLKKEQDPNVLSASKKKRLKKKQKQLQQTV